jgi:hypothetical protein
MGKVLVRDASEKRSSSLPEERFSEASLKPSILIIFILANRAPFSCLLGDLSALAVHPFLRLQHGRSP